jgi:hypothetical protein
MLARHSTDEQGAKMPSSSGDEMVGIHLLTHTRDPGPNGTLVQSGTVGTSPGPGVVNQSAVSALRRGRAWCLVENDVAITPGAAAFVRYSQNGAGKLQLGAFRADGDTSHAVAVNARFLTAAKTVPATSPYPGASAGGNQSSVLAAIVEFDASGAVI